MKKIVILLLSVFLLQHAYSQTRFTKKETALKYIKDAFEYAFKKGPFTYTDPKAYGKFVFRYEITDDKLLVVKNALEGKQGDTFYPYIWIEIPLEELVVLNKNNNVYKNTTNITLSTSKGTISTGYSEKGVYQPKYYYKHDEFYIPFNYAGIKDCLANLTAAFRFFNENKKEDVEAINNTSNGKSLQVKKEYYSTGELEMETSMKGEKKEGLTKKYYKSGKLKSFETYKDDKKNGPYEYYFENGQLRQICKYTNNKFDGYLKEYYSNGVLKNESLNVAGVYQGHVKSYSETGTLLSNHYYVKGKISGTLTVCEGVTYFLDILKNDKNSLLEDDNKMRLTDKNIQGFFYEYFAEGSTILNRPSHCRLDYIDEPTTDKGWLDTYNMLNSALSECKDLKMEKEYTERNDLGMLRQQIFRYNKTYYVQLEWYKSSLNERLTIYISRIENPKK